MDVGVGWGSGQRAAGGWADLGLRGLREEKGGDWGFGPACFDCVLGDGFVSLFMSFFILYFLSCSFGSSLLFGPLGLQTLQRLISCEQVPRYHCVFHARPSG